MASKATYSYMGLTFLVLLVMPTAWADPSIIANTQHPFTVSCNTTLPTSYTMVLGGLERVTIPGSQISCDFAYYHEGVTYHQGFALEPEYPIFTCISNSCLFEVAADGIYAFDTTSNSSILMAAWIVSTIVAETQDPFIVSCNTCPPTSYTMVVGGLAVLEIPETHIICNFTYVHQGLTYHQGFDLEPVYGLFTCIPDSCVFTVAVDGIYAFDTTSHTRVLMAHWILEPPTKVAT